MKDRLTIRSELDEHWDLLRQRRAFCDAGDYPFNIIIINRHEQKIKSMVNQDQKIKKLIKLNDELENYFRNTIIPQLFVDSDLILRKFTPPAMKQFSLKANDVGRKIEDIKDNFRFPTIVEIGIAESKHLAVFSKYSRVENTTEGSGVGLYLVNEIVTNSGGKIVLNSKLGQGSEFKVYLAD